MFDGYNYVVRCRITGTMLVMPHGFTSRHEAMMMYQGARYVELFKVTDGRAIDPPIAICVNGEWFVEKESEMYDLIIDGEYMEASGAAAESEDLIGNGSATAAASKKASTKKPATKVKTAAKPAAKASTKPKPVAKPAAKASTKPKANGKAAPAPAKRQATAERAARAEKIEDADTIRLLPKANEYGGREGTKTGDVWALCKKSASVKAFLKSFNNTKYAKNEGGMGFLNHFRRVGLIKIIGANGKAKT